MSKKIDILAIGAHPDDIELSASGTIIKSIQQGKTVAIVDLTQGELGTRGTKESRYEEAANASKIMGISYRENLKLEDGFFSKSKEDLMKLIVAIRRYRPEIVLANAVTDRHPDHGRASSFVSQACFLSGLLKVKTQDENGKNQEKWRPNAVYYYIQDRYIIPDLVVDVSDFKEQKFKAILAYKTQFYSENTDGPQTPISGKDFLDSVEAKMITFGREIGVRYGEGFTTERPIGTDDFFTLK